MANAADYPKRSYDPATNKLRTFHDARPGFFDGSDTPRDYLERCLEVIEAREPVVKAWVTLNIENAREAADQSTARYRKGAPLSLIDGMPVGIKDVIQTKDMPTELGSPIFKGRHTNVDSASVNALRLAGALIVGKTVTTEFAFVHPGPTTNPFDADATPGGSSSGSSAAIGAGMVPAALGNQVVGSVIRPAAFCGNYAIKPTLGALHGGEGLSLSQLHLGVHAGSLKDMWAVAHEIAHRGGADPGYPGLYGPQEMSPPQRPDRVILLETEAWAQADATTRSALHQVRDQLTDQGVTVLTRSDDRAIDRFERAIEGAVILCRIICSYELRWALRNYRDTGLLSDDLGHWLDLAEELSQQDYRDALHQREEMRAALRKLSPLADAMATLSCVGPAPAMNHLANSGEAGYAFKTGDPAFTAWTSVVGAPAITVPLLAIDGMPVGLQLIGQPHNDWQLAGHADWVMQRLKAVKL
jgi:Asp-tRNA(Asn)/Glu-tRNA(Gln) amidotransferase A subunit family amidase